MKPLSCAVLCGLVLVLSACGGGRPTEASGTMTSAQATSITNGSGGNQIEAMASPNVGGATGAFGADPTDTSTSRRLARMLDTVPVYRPIANVLGRAEDCDPVITGNDADADADGIKAAAVYTFSCNITQSTMTITASGVLRVTDANDADKKSGAEIVIENVKFTITGTADRASTFELTANTNGKISAAVAGKVITVAGEIALVIAGTANGQSASSEIGLWSTVTATGDSEEDPYAAGSITVDNYYKIKTSALDIGLKITSEDLKYGTCARSSRVNVGLTSGKLIAAAGAGKVTATFSSACQATWAFTE